MNELSKAQELQFELMKLATFNEYCGEDVVISLKEHKHLWFSAMMANDCILLPNDRDCRSGLIALRDLNKTYNVSTLFIIPILGKENELESLANSWLADEIDWIGGRIAAGMLGHFSKEIENNDKAILRVWWD